jgi:glycine/D-amino acid oxidase-like deaminating enzyme
MLRQSLVIRTFDIDQELAGSSRCDSHEADGSDIDDGEVVAKIFQAAVPLLPSLAPHLSADNPAISVRKGARPSSCTSKPCIGPIVGCDRLYMAAGHEGSGLTMALSTAEIVSALVLGDEELPVFADGFTW